MRGREDAHAHGQQFEGHRARSSRRALATRSAVCAAVVLAACERPAPPAHDAERVNIDAAVRDATRDATADVNEPVAPLTPAAIVESIGGGVIADTTDRVHERDANGVEIRPGGGSPAVGPVPIATPLYAGDRFESGDTSASVVVRSGARVVLGPHARIVIPPFAGSDLIVTRGAAFITPRAPTVIDTPGARVRASMGTLVAAVADDGSTLVGSPDTRIDAWPSPLPPTSSILGPRLHPEHHGTLGHPVSLDVQVNEVGEEIARPLPSVALEAGHALMIAPDGRVAPGAPHALHEADVAHWRAETEREVLRNGGHFEPIARMSRAGAGDLADAAALIARLRAMNSVTLRPLAIPDGGVGTALLATAALSEDRDVVENQLSAALGRATARADRARVLAARGGDVTPLVALARVEEVQAAARDVLPLRQRTTLDSAERRRVP